MGADPPTNLKSQESDLPRLRPESRQRIPAGRKTQMLKSVLCDFKKVLHPTASAPSPDGDDRIDDQLTRRVNGRFPAPLNPLNGSLGNLRIPPRPPPQGDDIRMLEAQNHAAPGAHKLLLHPKSLIVIHQAQPSVLYCLGALSF